MASWYPELRGFVHNIVDWRVMAVFSAAEDAVLSMILRCRTVSRPVGIALFDIVEECVN